MATPKIPKKEKVSALKRAQRLALKGGREFSKRYGKSLKSSKAASLLNKATKGSLKIPYPKGVNPAGRFTLVNRSLAPLGKGLLGRAALGIEGIQTARKVFNPDDNILLSAANVVQAARGREMLGKGKLATLYNEKLAKKKEWTDTDLKISTGEVTSSVPAGFYEPVEGETFLKPKIRPADFTNRASGGGGASNSTGDEVKPAVAKVTDGQVESPSEAGDSQKTEAVKQLSIKDRAKALGLRDTDPAAKAFTLEERVKLAESHRDWLKRHNRI
tara:strand:+ start:472 stop:1290 length:819 start_codon:yes stop_codon:yes gene_type:complete